MFKNLIAATDLILTRDNSVLTAASIARRNRQPLHILHVLECLSSEERQFTRHFRDSRSVRVDSGYVEEVRRAMESTYRDALAGISEVIFRIVPGLPWRETIRWADETGANLIVLGSRSGWSGVERVKGRVGTNTAQVIMREHCPVIIVNPNLDPDGLTFRTLLVAIDFSASCGHALRYAGLLAAHYQSSVHVFHMLPIPPSATYHQDAYDRDRKAAEKKLDAFLADHWNNETVERHIWGGVHPNLEIVACAEKAGADLIVMGSHTIEKNGKWYVGSAVERTSYRAKCPVAVISSAAAVVDEE